MKVSAFIALSVDGLVARENGDTTWFHVPNDVNQNRTDIDEEDEVTLTEEEEMVDAKVDQ